MSMSAQNINEIRFLNHENYEISFQWCMYLANGPFVNKEKEYMKGELSINQNQSSITGKDRTDKEYQY